MAAEEKNDILQLDTIRDIFQSTLKELFTNPVSCEETELHYFYIIESLESSESIYYDGEDLSIEMLQGKFAAGYKPLIKDYLQNTLKKESYILEESETYIKSGRLRKVFWVFFSECLDSNHGKLLLKCVFQNLADAFNQCLKGPIYYNEGSDSVRSDSKYAGLTQEILQKAETQAAMYVQKMFAPFNIDFVDSLSGEYYEKSACESNMVFLSSTAAKHLMPEDLLYCFNGVKFIPSNSRLIRKLLQITQNKLYLVLVAEKSENLFNVAGICTRDMLSQKLKKDNKMAIPYIMVYIKKHMQWEMFLGDIYIFTSRNGHYKIDRELQKDFMVKKLAAYFGGQKEDYNALFDNIQMSTRQTHGTMLVIMEAETARTEAKRLGAKRYGFPAPDPLLSKEGSDKKKLILQEINNLNSIDGCLIFDTDGNLYGIGMILDGIISKKGSLARGARYNSAIKYLARLDSISQKAMVLVVSEDGSVDMFSTEDVKDEVGSEKMLGTLDEIQQFI